MELSASIELLFKEAGEDFADRVRAAADAGIRIVEIWSHSNKNLKSLRQALDACNSRVWTLLVESRAPLADRESHAPFLEQVTLACRAANELGCQRIVTGSGVGFPYMKRAQQHEIVVQALRAGAEVAAANGVVLVLENLNTRVDHPGTLFDRTEECLAAIREVDSPGIALLYDVYHSLQMGEAPQRGTGQRHPARVAHPDRRPAEPQRAGQRRDRLGRTARRDQRAGLSRPGRARVLAVNRYDPLTGAHPRCPARAVTHRLRASEPGDALTRSSQARGSGGRAGPAGNAVNTSI